MFYEEYFQTENLRKARMSGQGGRHMVADEMFPDGPGALDFIDPEDGVRCWIRCERDTLSSIF